ncbi:hypothetical protein STENM36S_01273 [Streptomyces tendae]
MYDFSAGYASSSRSKSLNPFDSASAITTAERSQRTVGTEWVRLPRLLPEVCASAKRMTADCTMSR